MTGMSTIDIKIIESHLFRAWPALETRFYDGWVLRSSGGYTRRANSINPIYASTLDVDEKIELCEEIYGESVHFRLTRAACPGDLDEILGQRGYEKVDDVHVMLMSLEKIAPKPLPASMSLEVSEAISEDWVQTFTTYGDIESRYIPVMRRMLALIPGKRGLFTLKANEQTVAVGLGVADGDFVSMFDIVTLPDFRRKGYGELLVAKILEWGKASGAKHGFLQVVSENVAALKLYEKLGFETYYHYWYRSKRVPA